MEPLLVAVADDARARLAAILAGREIAFATTIEEVRERLRAQSVRALILGSHFDQSTALELLQTLSAEARPVICVHAVPFGGRLGRSTFHAFRTACFALGARAVIDLLEYPDDDMGNARVRAAIDASLDAVTSA
jgi:hypothetical protein